MAQIAKASKSTAKKEAYQMIATGVRLSVVAVFSKGIFAVVTGAPLGYASVTPAVI